MFELLTYKKSDPKISDAIWKIIDAVYPPFCCSCGVIGYEICPDCRKNIKPIDLNRICTFCGDYLNENHHCRFGDHHQFLFDQARSWAEYRRPLKQALQKIKYARGLGLIKELIPQISKFIQSWKISYDFITPVPLGRKRLADRGYNQSEIIAFPLASALNKQLKTDALIRTRETISQVGLNLAQRKQNVKDAFNANPMVCSGKSILLIDDITTTFSTINECASAMKKTGAKNVYCFTVARAVNL